MISHILFNLFSKYNIGSFGFRKILAILITALIFGLLYLTVRFTGMDIPNYTRNLAMLVTVDLAGFLFLMWKRPKETPKEETVEEVVEPIPVKIEPNLKSSKILEKEKEKEKEKEIRVTEEEGEGESKITIKKIEEVDEAKKL